MGETKVREFSAFVSVPLLIMIKNYKLFWLKFKSPPPPLLPPLSIISYYVFVCRAIFNLIINSIESIQEKALKIRTFDKKINIEIKRINNYIAINIFDNGIGFLSVTTKELIKPYYTTKKKGSGLGLSIVNKIINDHNGTIKFNSDSSGTNIILNLHIK